MTFKFILIFGIFMTLLACDNDNWTSTEKENFILECIDEGGSKAYCNCFLDKMMTYSPIAEEVDRIDFETKVELSKDCVKLQ